MTLTIAIERPAVKQPVDREGLAVELAELEATRKAELPVLQKAIAATLAKVRATREPYLEAKRANYAACGDMAKFEIDGTRVERIQNQIRDSAAPMITDVAGKIDDQLAGLRQRGIKISSVESRTLTGGSATKEVSNYAEVHAEMARLQQARQQCEALKLKVNIDAEAELIVILANLEGKK